MAQWLSNIHVPDHVGAHFEAKPVLGADLLALNDTMLMVPAEEDGLNVTAQGDRAKILDGVKRLEQHDPSDSTDSVLYLPLMLIGCGAFIYVMVFKGSSTEKEFMRWSRRMSKKVKNSSEANMGGVGGGLPPTY